MEKITNILEYFEGISAKKIKFKCDSSLTGNEKIKLRMFWNDNSHANFDFHIHDGDDFEESYPFICEGENETSIKEGNVNIDIFSYHDRNRIMIKGIPSNDYGLQLFWIQKDTTDVEVGSMPKVSIGYGKCEMF